MTNQILGALELRLVYGLMVLGVFITFRILKVPELTVDGSITLGMAVCAMLTNAGHPGLALIVALIAGALAGCITAFLQTKARIPPILAGIMTMSGLYSINLLIMDNGKPNISILGSPTLFSMFQDATGLDKHASRIIVGFLLCAAVVALVEFFFTTHVGLCIRATGDNEAMVRATSISTVKMKWIALAMANACASTKKCLRPAITRADRAYFRDTLARLNMGLEDRMKTKMGLLSGGQRQAITLLMAVIVTPDILLLDEHTAALDPLTAEKVLAITKEVVAEKHITTLMITHNIASALELGNRTLMMDDGQIVLDLSGEERASLSVEGLRQKYREVKGKMLDNDRILLS